MKKRILIIILIVIFIFPKNTYAYLDPGTGSYFIQVLIATLLGSLFFFKGFLTKVKNRFSKRQNDNEAESTDDNKKKKSGN